MQRDYQSELKELIESYDTWFTSPDKVKDGLMTSELYPFKRIFTPIQVNKVKIKNRIVMGPMGNMGMNDETGRPGNKMIAYFTERAKGGAGLITTGLVPVSFGIDPTTDDIHNLGIFPRISLQRSAYPGWRMLAERVHAYGSKIFVQLTAGLGRVGAPECVIRKFKLPVSASMIPNYVIPELPCRPLTDRQIRKIIKNAGQVSVEARYLSMDGIYLHGHEGYLIEQLTNPAFNHRTFGRFKDWQVFGIELIKEIRRRCGNDYPIMYRIDLSLALNETYGDEMRTNKILKKFRNERTIAMTLDYMENLVKAGVDIFDVDLGCYDNWWLPHPPSGMPAGCFLPIARMAKDYFSNRGILSNAGLEVPIVAVGKLGNPDLAERAIRDGWCDMVMLARPLLADPYWPEKAFKGRVDEIIPCVGDQEGCLGEFLHGGHLQCAVNPRTGLEDIYPDDEKTAKVANPRRIAVVGAGPAGILCATTAARRGHDVTLFDANAKAGGALIAGSVPFMKLDVMNYVNYLNGEVERSRKAHALTVNFQTKVTPEMLKEGDFDAIITCTGGKNVTPPIDGVTLPSVKQAVDVLLEPALAESARDIVIIGGGSIGCEVAHYLAYEMGKNVTVVEMLPYFMRNAIFANRSQLIYTLHKKGVKLMNCTRVKSISGDTVYAMQNLHKNVPNPYAAWSPVIPDLVENPLAKKIKNEETEVALPADLVLIAIGVAPDDALFDECVRIHAAPEIRNIGDSFEAGKIFEATKAGFAVGRLL